MNGKQIARRQAIPVLYTRGTNYEVGFDMGRTFAAMIQNFLLICDSLNETYIPLYNTEKGKKVYNETLASVKASFPHLILELEGVADGAQVEFYKLFLLHLDEILPQSVATEEHNIQPTPPHGCSSIVLNDDKHRVIAHTEDALTPTLNHYYFVVAHIINDAPMGRHKVKEERFMSLCYAGHLPGYTMSYNQHGLVCTVNTIAAEFLRSGKTPRHFIARSVLGAQNFDQVVNILKDVGVGAADGCSFNIGFLDDESKLCYNIEMAPAKVGANESILHIKEIKNGDFNTHVNCYDHIDESQANPFMLASSACRKKAFSSYKPPKTYCDVVHMLGDTSDGEYCVFQDDGTFVQAVKTICVGAFDLNKRTFTAFSDNPRNSEPQFTINLDFPKLVHV